MDNTDKQQKELLKILKDMSITDKKVLDALDNIPRHLFVPEEQLSNAYLNSPLPIAAGQTISQPYTVAFMLQELEIKPGNKILEIGTGSGWNAALLGYLTGEKGIVYSTELVEELIYSADDNLEKVNIINVKIIHRDGSEGYKEKAPFDRIIVTAACPEIPKPLIEQLNEDGILLLPLDDGLGNQKMVKIKKFQGKLFRKDLGYFSFVPLKGKYGYK